MRMVGWEPTMSNATVRAYEAIRASILSGDHLPDERLPEEHVAAAIGVSRTPVREALRRLAIEGLVRFVPNQGAFVASTDAAGLREIFSLRMMLEPHAASLAAERLGREELLLLREQARRMEALEARRPARFLQSIAAENNLFHRTVAEASRNGRLVSILGNLIENMAVLSTFSRYAPEDLRRSMGHHVELVDAFEHRDGAWAASVMRSHISAALHACQDRAKPEVAGAAA